MKVFDSHFSVCFIICLNNFYILQASFSDPLGKLTALLEKLMENPRLLLENLFSMYVGHGSGWAGGVTRSVRNWLAATGRRPFSISSRFSTCQFLTLRVTPPAHPEPCPTYIESKFSKRSRWFSMSFPRRAGGIIQEKWESKTSKIEASRI